MQSRNTKSRGKKAKRVFSNIVADIYIYTYIWIYIYITSYTKCQPKSQGRKAGGFYGTNDVVSAVATGLQTGCEGVREAVILACGRGGRDKDALGVPSGIKLYIQVPLQREGPCRRPCPTSLSVMQQITIEN